MRFLSAILSCLILSSACAAHAQAVEKNEPKEEVFAGKVTLELGEVTGESADALIDKMEELKKAGNTQELWIKINSPGGSVLAGDRIIDEIQSMPMKTVCLADHYALSMGFFILEACDERVMTKRTSLMVHEVQCKSEGNSSVLTKEAKVCSTLTYAELESVSERIGMPMTELAAKIDNKEWWMTWNEAVFYKAVDRIVTLKEVPPIVKIEAKPELLKMLLGG